MINRTKLSVIAVSAVLAVALTGCGGSASSAPSSVSSASASAPVSDAASPAADTTENGTADLDSAVETLLAADPISNQFEIAAMNIEYDFGLKAEDVAAYKGVKSNDNGDAGLVLVVEAASGKAQDVVTALERLQAGSGGFLRQLRRVCTGTEQRGKRHHLLQGRQCGHGDCLQRVHRRPEQCCGQRPEQLNLTF